MAVAFFGAAGRERFPITATTHLSEWTDKDQEAAINQLRKLRQQIRQNTA